MMVTPALAHIHATLHIHPETVAIAAVGLAISVVVWKIVTDLRRRKAR